MSSMLKLLTVTVLLSSISLSANSLKERILEFEKGSIDPRISIDSMEIAHEVAITDGWKGYVVDLTISMQGETREVKDVLFTDGSVVTRELMNLDSGESYNAMMEELTYPKLDSRYFDEKFLIAGSSDAKNTIAVFSNPGCPHCVRLMPGLIEQVNGSSDVALYYFTSPSALSLAMAAAKTQGVEDVEKRVYSALLDDQSLAQKASDVPAAIEVVNDILGSSVKESDFGSSKVREAMDAQMKLSQEAGIKATPTIFVNGEVDKSRQKMQELLN